MQGGKAVFLLRRRIQVLCQHKRQYNYFFHLKEDTIIIQMKAPFKKHFKNEEKMNYTMLGGPLSGLFTL